MSSQDARQRTKVYLETYILDANITKDNDLTQATWKVFFGFPDYPLSRIFKDKAVDLVFCVDTATSKSMRDFRQYPYAYDEVVPIEIFAVDKTGITGTKLRWKAEAELRRITEAYPLASIRWIVRGQENQKNLGSQTLYSVKYELGYIRPTAAAESFPVEPIHPPFGRSGATLNYIMGECTNPLLTLLNQEFTNGNSGLAQISLTNVPSVSDDAGTATITTLHTETVV